MEDLTSKRQLKYKEVNGLKHDKTVIWFLIKWVSVCLSSGRAIKHVKESIFTSEAGARRGVPKVLVVLTDGRSQDDVNKVSKEMQMEGWYFTDQTRNNIVVSLLLH